MADLSIFKLDSETITIKDTTARQAADSAKTLSTTASGNATTALNKVTELESEISALKSDLAKSFEPSYTEITTGFTSPVKNGWVRITRWGKFCVVDIDISVESNLDNWKIYKLCEVPKAAYARATGVCYGINNHRPAVLQVEGTTLSISTQGGAQATADAYEGQVVYVSN